MSDDLLRSLQGWEHSLANEERELLCRAIDEIAALRAALEQERADCAKLRAFALRMYNSDATYDILGDISRECSDALRECGLAAFTDSAEGE